jgi:hypothetical protein
MGKKTVAEFVGDAATLSLLSWFGYLLLAGAGKAGVLASLQRAHLFIQQYPARTF